ncbi:MAG TPA: DUF6328 family protein [Micromonosporaceae bacterium]|nr:DUF6328 family protein [Micromonosporaceae bacterium]
MRGTTINDRGAGEGSGSAHDGRRETEAERADRNFNELLQELRVAQTGVQILFAFLLTLPFTERFSAVQAEDKVVYLTTVICTAVAMACLVAPVSHHRIMFAQGLKRQLVQSASRFAATGLVFLFIAVLGAIYLIVDVVVNTATAGVITGSLAVLFVTLWYIVPLRRRRRHARQS